MMSVTHAALAVAATTLSIGTADPWLLGLSVLGSQLPDLDTTASITGRIGWPIACWIEARFPHRTVTHSFMASGVVAALALPLWLGLGWQGWAALVLGHFVGWFSDAFTKSGVGAFWPHEARLVIPGNPRARLNTHSPAEYWVLAIAVLLTVFSVNLTSAGGLSEAFSRTFLRDVETAASLYHRDGGQHRLYAAIEGSHTKTGAAIAGEYEILGAGSATLMVRDGEGRIYQVGGEGQIRATRIKTRVGESFTLKATPQTLQEIGIAEWVATVPPGAYLSGELVLDDLLEFPIPHTLETYPTVQGSDTRITLTYASPSYVGAVLGDGWILLAQVVVQERL
jgi:inner membrane protein